MAGKGRAVMDMLAVRNAERALAIGYAPPRRRAAIAALLALDDVFARIVRTTREPIVGQMRLTWWYEALTALDVAPAPAEPVLAALAADVLPNGVSGAALAKIVEGWEVLLDGDALDEAALSAHAAGRGGAMFAAMARVLDGPAFAPLGVAGAGWALADLSRHLSEPVVATAAHDMAGARLAAAFERQWPSALRPIGMLALLARSDLGAGDPRPGAPRRLLRLLMHRIWGR